MCKRQTHRNYATTLARQGAYEGQTIRLGSQAALVAKGDRGSGTRRGPEWRGSFPWWTLWLIWPVVVLVTKLVPLALSTTSAAFAQVHAAGVAPAILAVLLMVAGLALVRRG